jgi:DNA-binding transcriptional regulator YdaS (Cro superfamily)
MNPQEKLEKLRWWQQVQAQLAVEQQQLALWGLMAIDVPVLSQMPSGIMPIRPLKQSAISLSSEISPQEPL